MSCLFCVAKTLKLPQRDFLFWAKLHVTAHEPKYQAFQGVSQQKSVQKFAMRRDFEQRWDGFRAFLCRNTKMHHPPFFLCWSKKVPVIIFCWTKKMNPKSLTTWTGGETIAEGRAVGKRIGSGEAGDLFSQAMIPWEFPRFWAFFSSIFVRGDSIGKTSDFFVVGVIIGWWYVWWLEEIPRPTTVWMYKPCK